MTGEVPIYSHNPYHVTKFPLLVLDIKHRTCTPSNEGFQMLHWHDEVQFVYILKGIVNVKIYDEEFEMKEHDCVFINRCALHHITEKVNCHYHSYIIPTRMLAFFPGSIMEQNDVFSVVNNPTFTHYLMYSNVPAHNSVLHQIGVLDKLYFQDNKYEHQEYRLSIQLSIVWLELLSLIGEMKEVSTAKNYERIRTLISIIHANYESSLTTQDIADAAHISKTECLRCFRKFIHESPYHYLLKYRLHMSTSLLIATDMSVTDISVNVGFHSASSYIKYFKQYYQTTPNKYRIENKAFNHI